LKGYCIGPKFTKNRNYFFKHKFSISASILPLDYDFRKNMRIRNKGDNEPKEDKKEAGGTCR
jgi:hypothetical protein